MKWCYYKLLTLLSIVSLPYSLSAMNEPLDFTSILLIHKLAANNCEIIETISDGQELKRILLYCIINLNKQQANESNLVIANTIERINTLEKTTHAQIRFVNDDILDDLIENFDRNPTDNSLNGSLPYFVSWFIEHGIPLTKDAMRKAIMNNRIDVVMVLRTNGINPTHSYSDRDNSMNFIVFAQSRNKITLADFLAKPATQHSITWYTTLSHVAIHNEHPDKITMGTTTHNPVAPSTDTEVLNFLAKIDNSTTFNTIVSRFNSTEQRQVKTYITAQKPNNYQEKIVFLNTLIPSSGFQLRTAAGLIAAAIAATALYKWAARSPAAAHIDDVLVNTTNNSIFVSHNQDTAIEIKPNAHYSLPQTGILAIAIDHDRDKADLTIDLNNYAANRTDHYLNISISKNWLSWLFGPLRYAIYWVEKSEKSDVSTE